MLLKVDLRGSPMRRCGREAGCTSQGQSLIMKISERKVRLGPPHRQKKYIKQACTTYLFQNMT